ncbi:hypothetical protein NRIC_07310 [Enterococcus florum]|uniref:Uncharacterized protein n=1 Tax=Enterococcus florum TaxID=2480627 RepID=A0A4P5P581_9ENTE|nr:hypothetical protein [Enterococcus florum]GCF92840.1 hypothetical protein NRIC_07310 [Enterococcus florum]
MGDLDWVIQRITPSSKYERVSSIINKKLGRKHKKPAKQGLDMFISIEKEGAVSNNKD